ncbi:MAG: PKD domain-containing protein [Gammaproteobacteria bacterium]|nr:PKD domain-containing protein [Gammaproteobacteria bacterium]
MKRFMQMGACLCIQAALLAPLEAAEKVNQSVDLGGSRQATWYLPDGQPDGWILLQHGFQRNKSHLDHIATTFMNNGIMVLTINSNSTGGNRSLAREIADDLIDNPLTPPNGYQLPSKLVLSGHSAGALMMSYTSGRLIERGFGQLEGLIMYDPVDKDNGMQPNNQALIDTGKKVLSILANSSSCNSSNNALSPLRALSESYVGIKLTRNSKHTDAEGDSTGGLGSLFCGRPTDQNVSYLQDFAVNWALDMISGSTNPAYYPGGAKVQELIANNDGELIKEIVSFPPTADFNFSTNLLSVSFSDNSSDQDGSIISYSWDFGDGDASSQQNPNHSYQASGTYNVTLTVTDDDNQATSVSKVVSVSDGLEAPEADFSFVANELSVSFSDASSDNDGTIQSWDWNFGDGSSSNQASPVHTYAENGTYNVSLTVTDEDGLSDTKSMPVTVQKIEGGLENNSVISNLSAGRGEELDYFMQVPANASNLVFQIADGSGDADIYIRYGAEPTTSTYDYRPYRNGNNETVTIDTPQSGEWYIMIRGYSAFSGVTLRASYQVAGQNLPPEADFSFDYSGSTVSFTNQSSDADGEVASYQWSFGDGSESSDLNPSHTYDSAGTYNVTLSIADDKGATDQVTKTVTITDDGATPLVSGQVIEGLSGTTGNQKLFVLDVSAGTSQAEFRIFGGGGDADIYVRYGAAPTTNTYDYRPYRSGNNETVTVGSPAAGKWYVMVRAYSNYSDLSLSGEVQ